MAKLTDYMHTAEAAEYLGVHHNTIRNWAARGEIPKRRNPADGYHLDKFLRKVAQPVKPGS